MPFDLLRPFRPRSHSASVCLQTEDDSDASSPEREHPHIIRVSGPVQRDPRKGLADKSRQGTHFALSLDSPHRPERPSRQPPVVASARPADSVDALQLAPKPTLIRRVTSKLHISIPSRSAATQPLRSRPSTRTLPSDMSPQGPRAPRPTPAVPALPNSFVSKQHREAALRERGLLPPRKDLSEQEREADQRLACVPSPVSLTFDGATEAERFKARWLATNRTSNSSESDSEPAVSPLLMSSSSVPPPSAAIARRSLESRTDLPPAGRPSMCSSAPPLSTSSFLEVLHEEPSEQGPLTPPPPLLPPILPIIVSSPPDYPPSPVLVESPVSYTFSSHCPGSTFESHSQSGRPLSIPDKENVRTPSSRKRTGDSADRPRRGVGSSLTRLGSHSLTNLRRTVAGSLRAPSSSTLASGDHASSISQAPRMAIDPTMHSIGSIIRETKDIKDVESRRLSELAFLD